MIPDRVRVLVVDDEPDLELLISQRFRRQIRDGSLSFAFAQDGVLGVCFARGPHKRSRRSCGQESATSA